MSKPIKVCAGEAMLFAQSVLRERKECRRWGDCPGCDERNDEALAMIDAALEAETGGEECS